MNNLNYAKSYHQNINLKLDNISALLKELDNPHEGLIYIHIGGTNGKGSVCAFLEEMLVKEGFKTGRFSSPELIRRNETIRINKNDISDKELNSLLKRVHSAAEKLSAFPSPYEILCGAAFLYFKEQACDYVILEVGMGGEGDATNIIPPPIIAVITKIAMDHSQYLGNSPEEIARVKSGIIKKGSKTVTTSNNRKLFNILDKNNNLISVSPFDSAGFEEIYENIIYNNKKINLSLGGVNQRENAALAVKAAELLGLREESIIYGLSNARNPARFEKIKNGIFFDGAHNPDGAEALSLSIKKYFPDKKKTFIMGVMKDKEFKKMLEILDDGNSDFIFLDVKDNERAMKKEDMLLNLPKAKTAESIKEAIEMSASEIKIICGSLYMYKDIRL